jgi:hypothetical protein
MSSIELEILKPAIFAMPEEIDTIAIFNRDFYQSDTIAFKYVNGDNHKATIDSSIHYSIYANECVEALSHLLENEGYFMKVMNYKDSLNGLFSKDSIINYPELHKKLGADAFVFLDYFKLKDTYAENQSGFTFFMSSVKDKFPEFQNSTKVASIVTDLLWTITFKGDTSIYILKQPESLYYGNSAYPTMFGNVLNHKALLKNTAEYLGKSFATKIIPSWEKVNRTYYRSNNDTMLRAEQYFLVNDWMKAAEIYQKETTNKNRNIAAKATYNMALICEMEGQLDAATDWLDRSKSVYKNENQRHTRNCTQYSAILEERKEEIEFLGKQVRHSADKP